MRGYLTVGRERENTLWEGTVHGSCGWFDERWFTYIKLQVTSYTLPYTLTYIYGVNRTPGDGIAWNQIPSYYDLSLTRKDTAERIHPRWVNVPLLVGYDLPFFSSAVNPLTEFTLFDCVDCSGDLLCRDEEVSIQIELDMTKDLKDQLPDFHIKLQNIQKKRQGLKNDT